MNIKRLTKEVAKVSAKYTKKYNIDPDGDWYILKLQEELGELIQAHLMMTGRARTKGKSKEELQKDFEKELADVMGQILLLAKYSEIDIEKVIDEKWLVYNRRKKKVN